MHNSLKFLSRTKPIVKYCLHRYTAAFNAAANQCSASEPRRWRHQEAAKTKTRSVWWLSNHFYSTLYWVISTNYTRSVMQFSDLQCSRHTPVYSCL